MSVMVPPGHRGAAVEVNIQPPGQQHHTLISVYQYRGDEPSMPPPSSRPSQHESPVVPPEPVPSAPYPPAALASPAQTPMLTRMLSPATSHAVTDAAAPYPIPADAAPPPKKKGRPRKIKDGEPTPPKEKGKRGRKKKSDEGVTNAEIPPFSPPSESQLAPSTHLFLPPESTMMAVKKYDIPSTASLPEQPVSSAILAPSFEAENSQPAAIHDSLSPPLAPDSTLPVSTQDKTEVGQPVTSFSEIKHTAVPEQVVQQDCATISQTCSPPQPQTSVVQPQPNNTTANMVLSEPVQKKAVSVEIEKTNIAPPMAVQSTISTVSAESRVEEKTSTPNEVSKPCEAEKPVVTVKAETASSVVNEPERSATPKKELETIQSDAVAAPEPAAAEPVTQPPDDNTPNITEEDDEEYKPPAKTKKATPKSTKKGPAKGYV